MKFVRIALALAAPMLLASCLLSPGKFVSTLDIKADRSFTFTYAGEVILTDPADAMAEGAAEGLAAAVSGDGSGNAAQAAPPAAPAVESAATIAKRKAVAEALAREVGYRSVDYLGHDKYRVDYSISGRLDRSFLYPINIDAQAIIPWIAVEVRKDGTARMMALAFGDDDAGPGGMGGMGARGGKPDKPKARREGLFTLTTDATLVMQNNEEGLAPGPGTKVVWRVTPTSKSVPTAVVRFAH